MRFIKYNVYYTRKYLHIMVYGSIRSVNTFTILNYKIIKILFYYIATT